ncbi:MAG: tRNA epoxyqueuosine(34) reductase QueG, partial [Fimbriimonas ginsengisoli]|nr:tRNA epoxyqueuosine(34) reductase QueG [Fimbriimonas ginsengisoli]
HRANDTKPGLPRIAEYALGRDYHKVLRSTLRKLARWMQERWPEAECRACVDSAPILERELAHLAGLGWFGKNTCLIDSRRGSKFFLGVLLTSIALPPDRPAIGSCGTCSKCIDACPTGAIVHADGFWQLDARRCISYLTIEHRGAIDPALREGIGDWTFGCDVCQDVCPFNHPRPSQPSRATETTEPDFSQDRNWPALKELCNLPYQKWDELTCGSAVRRAGFDGLRRNAAINLQNATSDK